MFLFSIVLNPFAPLNELKGRDALFFSKDILFSNTVRTMVNLNDDVFSDSVKINAANSHKKMKKKRNGKKPVNKVKNDKEKPTSNTTVSQMEGTKASVLFDLPTFVTPKVVNLYDRTDPTKFRQVTIKEFRDECARKN